MTLSKSLYTRAIQCPKSLWLKKYKPEVLTPPDASAKARFETGNIVGDLAFGHCVARHITLKFFQSN